MDDNEEYLELFSESASKLKFDPIDTLAIEEDAEGTSTLRKHISIKLRQTDLDALKKEAERRGLRYQSLINSILHQYVTGHLKATA
jgi:predicted DNA binding CopG/RHH family protein